MKLVKSYIVGKLDYWVDHKFNPNRKAYVAGATTAIVHEASTFALEAGHALTTLEVTTISGGLTLVFTSAAVWFVKNIPRPKPPADVQAAIESLGAPVVMQSTPI